MRRLIPSVVLMLPIAVLGSGAPGHADDPTDAARNELAMKYCTQAVGEFVGLRDIEPLPGGGSLSKGDGDYSGRKALITSTVFEFRDGRKSIALCEFAWLYYDGGVLDVPGLVTMHVDGREPDPIEMQIIALRLLREQ